MPWTKLSNEAQSNCDLVKSEIELVMSKANKAKEALANAQQVLKDAEPKRKEKQKALRDKQAQLAKTRAQLEEGKTELQMLGVLAKSFNGFQKPELVQLLIATRATESTKDNAGKGSENVEKEQLQAVRDVSCK